MQLNKHYISRAQYRALSKEYPIGDAFGGPAYGKKEDMITAVTAGASIIGGMMSSDAQSSAADTAANAQTQSSAASIAETRRQFDALAALLKPYSNAATGTNGQGGSLFAQQNLLGLNGNEAQQSAIDGIKNSSQFNELAKQGEQGILQNASATGGLRGGNIEAALAQFRPAMLNQLIAQQYGNLGGITSLGQNAAAMQGNAGMQSAGAISAQLGQQGAAQAGAALAQGNAQAQMWNGIGSGVGVLAGRYGSGNNTPTPIPTTDNSGGFLGNGITGSAF